MENYLFEFVGQAGKLNGPAHGAQRSRGWPDRRGLPVSGLLKSRNGTQTRAVGFKEDLTAHGRHRPRRTVAGEPEP